MSVNKALIMGNVGRDPEIRHSISGTPIANISVATSERRKNSLGEYAEETEWHRVVAFGKTAEAVGRFVTKGSKVFVEGRISTRKWKNKDGVDQYSTEIVADRVEFLDAKSARMEDQGKTEPEGELSPDELDFDDDIPF